MKIKPGDYCRIYEALVDKFIQDFYEGEIAGIDPESHHIWYLRFNQVKRLKHKTTVSTSNGKYNYGDDLIPIVLFGLTDTQGKYFHTKWREALKQPSIFSVTTECLYKALIYVLDSTPFSIEKLAEIRPTLLKKELEIKVEELKRQFFGYSPTVTVDKKKILLINEVEDKLSETISNVVVNFFSLIIEKKIIQAWQLLSDRGQRNVHWGGFQQFREFYYSEIRQTQNIRDLHVFKISVSHSEASATVYYKEKFTCKREISDIAAETIIKFHMKKEPEGGLTRYLISSVTDPRNDLYTHEYFGIDKNIWDFYFNQFDTHTIVRLQEFKFVRIQGFWLIDEILNEEGVNSDVNFMKVEIW